MNILLIDSVLPSSRFSGKSIRLLQGYGRIAKAHRLIYLRISPTGSLKESPELESWARDTFHQCLRMKPLRAPKLFNRLKTLLRLKPWYDLESKYPDQTASVRRHLAEIRESYRIDLVINLGLDAAPYAQLMMSEIPWIQDLGDSTALQLSRRIEQANSLGQTLFYRLRKVREASYEQEMIQKSSATIFVAADDASIFPAVLQSKIAIVPNGVDSEYFDPGRVAPYKADNPYVIFTGHMSFLPNQDAACYFAQSIFPLIQKQIPNVEFWVVGAEPREKVINLKNIRGITVTGQVEDLRPYLAGAQTFVCPMRIGSGIKNKVLEAMSMGLPIIASKLAVAGIAKFSQTGNEIADDPTDFSNRVIGLIKDDKVSKALGKTNRRFVSQNFSWEKAVERYEALFRKISDHRKMVAIHD